MTYWPLGRSRARPVARNPQFDYSKPYGIRPLTWLVTPKAVPTQIALVDRTDANLWYPFFDEVLVTVVLSDTAPWNFFEIRAEGYAAVFIEDDAEFLVRAGQPYYDLIFSAERSDRPFLVPSRQDRDKLFVIETTGALPDLPLRVSEYVVSV